ncbi:inositol-1-monophosphatase [Idiomarina piscisalsi]|jgi:myo-inositol-1(or 4)-monophosphatase|uniref:Inositol-1-monophosphatase n=1 Tax=Idiomarina piscisalsi TaxID=1096243 RepID=A0ABM6LRL5_9GAMM|nr:inositol-1-monophosphatase [Idiomarina piscisalsi]ASG65148.1 inositol monophosphatase [Idiomarina piscisalsi]MTJ02178.1 inositol-1-monophosphatase [Idiomarina piscisalsi]
MHPMLNIAVRAARAAGKILVKNFDQGNPVEAESKGLNDWVTDMDKAAEQAIINTIKKSYPDHGIIAEESGTQAGTENDFQWVIDPLDGTTNYMRGIPHFCISIALLHKGSVQQAVVYDPIREELFTASRGAGAQLNGRRLRISPKVELKGAILSTGFPFKMKSRLPEYLEMFNKLFEHCADVRRAGAAALDLAYVAAGRHDAFWEMGLKPWDILAGELLVREAGGIVSDFQGGHNYVQSGNIAAGAPKALKQMLAKIR